MLEDEPQPTELPRAASLSERVVVVLGGASGLGLEVAVAISARGAAVVVADTGRDEGEAAAARLRRAGGRAQFVQANLDDEASLARLQAEAETAFGPVAALILEAPVMTAGPVLSLPAAEWEAAVSRPLRRALMAAQAFLPAMLERRAGTVLALVMPEPQTGLAAFSAAQQGLTGFVRALGAELAPAGVRAIALGLAPSTLPVQAAEAAARLLAQPGDTTLETANDVLIRTSAGATSPEALPIDRAAHLIEAVALSQQLATLLLDTDSEFDRLPVAVRPMARGVFKSKVGYRSQDVLRAVHKLTDQLQRMQASHSATDTEFQVDYPLLAALLERLLGYYQVMPEETARLTDDSALVGDMRHQMAERQALIQKFLRELDAVHL